MASVNFLRFLIPGYLDRSDTIISAASIISGECYNLAFLIGAQFRFLFSNPTNLRI